MIKGRMIKKIIFSFLLLVFLFSSIFARTAHAQAGGGNWYDPSFTEWNSKVFESPDSEIFGERYTYAQVKWIFYSITAIVTGTDSKTVSCLMNSEISGCYDVIKQELSSRKDAVELSQTTLATTVLQQLSSSPVSGVYYFRNVAQRLNIVPEASAQEAGFGFTALNPILNLWRASRNITYAFFVIIVLVMAFMIMFRVKISPQTVITVQSALPKLIIALILVTFSYAIAGLVIDLMYVVMGLVVTMLISTGFLANTTNWSTLFSILTNGPLNTGAFGLVSWYYTLFPLALVWSLVQAFSTFSATGVILSGLGLLLLPIILIVVGFILLWTALKLLWLLFSTFARIVLLIVVSPFMIALGAIVSSGGFGSWLRSLVSQLAVYPIVATMFSLAYIFLTGSIFSIFANKGGVVDDIFNIIVDIQHKISPIDFNPELLSGSMWSPPLTAGTELTSILWLGLSFVLITMTPQVAELIKSIIQGQPFAYGTAIGQVMGTGRYMMGEQLRGLARSGRLPFYEKLPGYKKLPPLPTGGKVSSIIENVAGAVEGERKR